MKKFLVATGTITLAVSIFAFGGFYFAPALSMASYSAYAMSAQNTNTSFESDAHVGQNRGETGVPEAFHSINIDALSPDVRVVVGDDYAVSYKLHDREHMDVLEVRDGVLHLDTGYDFEFDVDYGNFYIVVSVPRNTALTEIDIKTVAGNIYTDIATIEKASLITTSGSVEVNASEIQMLLAKSTSENVDVSGALSQVDVSSVSGDCVVETSRPAGEVQTVSGDITVQSDEITVSASSFGQIRYNGDAVGYRYENSSNPDMALESVSGRITIE